MHETQSIQYLTKRKTVWYNTNGTCIQAAHNTSNTYIVYVNNRDIFRVNSIYNKPTTSKQQYHYHTQAHPQWKCAVHKTILFFSLFVFVTFFLLEILSIDFTFCEWIMVSQSNETACKLRAHNAYVIQSVRQFYLFRSSHHRPYLCHYCRTFCSVLKCTQKKFFLVFFFFWKNTKKRRKTKMEYETVFKRQRWFWGHTAIYKLKSMHPPSIPIHIWTPQELTVRRKEWLKIDSVKILYVWCVGFLHMLLLL